MKQVLVWVLMIVGAVAIYAFLHGTGGNVQEISYLELTRKINNKEVSSITIKPGEVAGSLTNGAKFTSKISSDFVVGKLSEELVKNNVDFKFDPTSAGGLWASILITWAPILLIAAFWIFMLRQMQSGGNKALSFGKSRAKLLSNQQKRVTKHWARARPHREWRRRAIRRRDCPSEQILDRRPHPRGHFLGRAGTQHADGIGPSEETAVTLSNKLKKAGAERLQPVRRPEGAETFRDGG